MASIYTQKKKSTKRSLFQSKLFYYFFLALTVCLALYTIIIEQEILSFWGFVTFVSLIITIFKKRDVNDLKKLLDHENHLFHKLSALSDDTYVFQSTPIEAGGFGYTVDYMIITPACVFVIFNEKSEGIFEGSVDHDLWKYTSTKRGKTVTKDIYFPISILRQQTFYTAQMLTEKGVKTWVQGVLYFSNEHTTAKGTGKNTAVIDDPDELIHYVSNFKPRIKMDQPAYEKAVKVIKKRKRAKKWKG